MYMYLKSHTNYQSHSYNYLAQDGSGKNCGCRLWSHLDTHHKLASLGGKAFVVTPCVCFSEIPVYKWPSFTSRTHGVSCCGRSARAILLALLTVVYLLLWLLQLVMCHTFSKTSHSWQQTSPNFWDLAHSGGSRNLCRSVLHEWASSFLFFFFAFFYT